MRRRMWLVMLLAVWAVALGLLLPSCATERDSLGLPGNSDVAVREVDTDDGAAATAAAEDPANGATDAAGTVDAGDAADADGTGDTAAPAAVDEDGTYTSKEDVALYLHTYGHLPGNYVTKDEAEDAGWKTEGLSLDEACPGMSIGGDRFGNREGKLPKAKGRTWYECDIDYQGERSRNAKRIVYSNDGLIYYTEDHYNTFERLY